MGLSGQEIDLARRDLGRFLDDDCDGVKTRRLRAMLQARRDAVAGSALDTGDAPAARTARDVALALQAALALLQRLTPEASRATHAAVGADAPMPRRAAPDHVPDGTVMTRAEVALLVELGFLGLDRGHDEAAAMLFRPLAALRTPNPYPRIGLAILADRRGHRDVAIAWLQEVVADHPGLESARRLLARFVAQAERPGCESPVQRAAGVERVAAGLAARGA